MKRTFKQTLKDLVERPSEVNIGGLVPPITRTISPKEPPVAQLHRVSKISTAMNNFQEALDNLDKNVEQLWNGLRPACAPEVLAQESAPVPMSGVPLADVLTAITQQLVKIDQKVASLNSRLEL